MFSKVSRISKKYVGCRFAQTVHPGVIDCESSEWNSALPYDSIPGPKALPLVGNTWRFLPFIGDFKIEHIDKVCRQLHQTYGKIVKMEGLLGRPDMLFLFDPDLIERVFRQEDTLPYRPSMPSLTYYKHKYKREIFGENGGVIAVHGEEWQKFRSKVNQIMLQPSVANQYIDTINEASDQFVERIEYLKDTREEVPGDFLNEIHKWSLESLARVALDIKLNCLVENPRQHTQELIDAVNTFFMGVPILELKNPMWRILPTPTFRSYINALDTIYELCNQHIEEAMKRASLPGEKCSVLQRVLKNHDSKIAKNLALDLFLVGIDTTSNAVASVLYQLAQHPDIQEKLYETLSMEGFLEESTIDLKFLKKAGYLKACIKETMRMFPVVIGNGRCTTSNSVVGGYQVPKGVQVIFQHYVISNLDEYFPRSSEFLPERWLSKDQNNTRHNFASLPFGFGKRMCLGRRFADLEMQIVIAKVIKNYKVSYNYPSLDYHIHPMFTPNGPLRFKFERRIPKTD
ncbi:probable cytochrome P450 49a1 [Coccinella septempunctata]|uniref:probable cytochrome P450 49a1 n=1 Tax=Coccinella septempunctata TaxID=41139 RepID=UPI001D092042|nr:probable cytochrome P450 49a1 [Coccinella septempunctata]